MSPTERSEPTSEDPTRLIVDERGVEWEVYDEGSWTIELALEWDHLPQEANPGLIFASPLDRRRLWPCPDNWRDLPDGEILRLLAEARSVV